MKKLLLSSLLGCACASFGAEFQINGAKFTVPEGFEVQLVAESPLIDRPIVADFDQFGRLYVADSSGSNDKVEKQLAEKPHRIVRLEDTNGDGVYDKSIVFADKMMFPEGALYYRGSLYVSAPPSIWKLTDTDLDGVADQREEWMQGKTLTGCANDLHGPYLGPDGWIYWAKGAFGEQSYELPTGKQLKTRAAHLFRRRPEGGPIEPVMTGGMDNPVEIAFTKTGERFFTTTFFQHPGGGQRDGLVHAIYGGVYGKIHDVIDSHPRTGEVMPVMTHMGAAAPSGLMRYDSDAFGEGYRDNLFAALFNLRKVTGHRLRLVGAAYQTEDFDFLTSDDPDFHPTDVLMDGDGSLLVIDTGGWYKLCCPTSQLAKPDVLGAIYRVRRVGARKLSDPWGLQVAPFQAEASTIQRLKDPRPAIVARAVDELAQHGEKGVRALEMNGIFAADPQIRLNTVWTLTRIDHPEARGLARKLLDDADETVRWAATHSASVWRDTGALSQLTKNLSRGSAGIRRATAEALGRVGNKFTARAILDSIDTAKGFDPMDRPLEHSLTYALIEIGEPEPLVEQLRGGNVHQRKAALIALDQRGHARPEHVLPLLASSNAVLSGAARWVASRHSEWGESLAGYFRERLTRKEISETEAGALQTDLAQFAKSEGVQQLLAESARGAGVQRGIALGAMSRSGLREMPPPWAAVLTELINTAGDARLPAVRAARAFSNAKQNLPELRNALLAAGSDPKASAELRLEALAGAPGRLEALPTETFDFLRARTGNEQPVHIRALAVAALTRSKLSEEQLLALSENVKKAGPMEIIRLLDAYEAAAEERVGATLASALKEASSFSALRPDIIKARFARFPAPVQARAKELIKALNQDAEQQNAHLEELLSQLKNGDVRRGQAVFNSPQAACSSCHAIGYLGGKAGPDLTSISAVRTERDLLESIIYPSASFVRSYEPVTVLTKSGDEHSGVLKKDAPEEVILATGPEAEVRLARAEIAEMRPGSISMMPQGLDQQLSKQDLADLLAFLKNTKWGAQ